MVAFGVMEVRLALGLALGEGGEVGWPVMVGLSWRLGVVVVLRRVALEGGGDAVWVGGVGDAFSGGMDGEVVWVLGLFWTVGVVASVILDPRGTMGGVEEGLAGRGEPVDEGG